MDQTSSAASSSATVQQIGGQNEVMVTSSHPSFPQHLPQPLKSHAIHDHNMCNGHFKAVSIQDE
jgi:hypothetical protein